MELLQQQGVDSFELNIDQTQAPTLYANPEVAMENPAPPQRFTHIRAETESEPQSQEPEPVQNQEQRPRPRPRSTTPPEERQEPHVAHPSVTASELIERNTAWWGDLREEDLAVELFELVWQSSGHYELVLQVLDELGSLNRDDVAAYFVDLARDDHLNDFAATAAGRAMLERLHDELTTGYMDEQDTRESQRVVEALSSRRRTQPRSLTGPVRAEELSGSEHEEEVELIDSWLESHEEATPQREELEEAQERLRGELTVRQITLQASRITASAIAAQQRGRAGAGDRTSVAAATFMLGFFSGAYYELRPSELENLITELRNHPIEFGSGVVLGIPMGEIEGAIAAIEDLIVLISYVSIPGIIIRGGLEVAEFAEDYESYIRDRRQIAEDLALLLYQIANDPGFLTEHGEELGQNCRSAGGYVV